MKATYYIVCTPGTRRIDVARTCPLTLDASGAPLKHGCLCAFNVVCRLYYLWLEY